MTDMMSGVPNTEDADETVPVAGLLLEPALDGEITEVHGAEVSRQTKVAERSSPASGWS